MPRISQYTTELPGSTSRLIGNVGSTTVGFDAGQLLGAVFTSQGQLLYAGSSKNSTFLNPPSSNAILSYSSGSSAPTWIVGSPGQIFYVSSAGLTTILVVPTSGAVLVYSTVNTSVGPRWEIPTSGSLLGASSVGLPTWIALGTSGQVLESTGGRPTWVAYPADPTTGHITTAGTSGQILQTTVGTATWVNFPADPTTGHITTAGSSGSILITSSAAGAIWSSAIFINTSQQVGVGTTTPGSVFESSVTGTSNDVKTILFHRNASYTGGAAGFVNSALRTVTNVSSNASAYEWGILSIMNSTGSGENVAIYAQAKGAADAPVWGMVAETSAAGTSGTAIGIEVDAGGPAGANIVGIDIVNTGGMDNAIRVPPNVGALVNGNSTGTYLEFLTSGLSLNAANFTPAVTAIQNFGDSSHYWNDISHKTLTDRGCLGWYEDGVELVNGSVVSDVEAIMFIKKHPTLKTLNGAPRLDYASMPTHVYKPGGEGADGAELTALISVMIGALRELNTRLEKLEDKD